MQQKFELSKHTMINTVNTWIAALLPSGAEKTLMVIGGWVGAAMSFAFGDVGPLLIWLLIFVVFDVFTGVWAAKRTTGWISHKYYIGITKKILIFVMVSLAHGLDFLFNELIHHQIFESIVICAYAAGEFGSIIENLERGGLSGVVPPVIRRLVRVLNEKVESTVDKIADKEKKE